MIMDTKDTIRSIMSAWGGLPEEGSWIEYKSACEFTRSFRKEILCEVTAFLNSVNRFGRDKFILFGISEDKTTKEKRTDGLGSFKFPDDNEWQDLFGKIKPYKPLVETGTFDYEGLLFGYLYIPPDNYHGPYCCPKNGKDIYWIRRGGSKCNDITDSERAELKQRSAQELKAGRTFTKTRESLVLTAIGQYSGQNRYDQGLIEEHTGETFDQFQRHCLIQDCSMVQRRDSLYGYLRSAVSQIDGKHNRLLQLTPDEVTVVLNIVQDVLEHRDVWYSEELLDGVMDTLVFLSDNGYSHFTRQVIRSVATTDLFDDSRYQVRISSLAEAAPDVLLALIKENRTALSERPKHKRAIASQALCTIAWFPEHYEEAARLLLDWGDQEALYGLLHWGQTSTAASFRQKLQMVRETAARNRELAFNVLNRVLDFNPKLKTVVMQSYIPSRYRRLTTGTFTIEDAKLQTYYSELLEAAGDNAGRILELLPSWLRPYPFSNLYWLAAHIKEQEPNITDPHDREKLWNRLCNTPLVFNTDEEVGGNLKKKLTEAGRLFKPGDPYADYRLWFRENVARNLSLGGLDYPDARARAEQEQKEALSALYQQGGISQVISFLATVSADPYSLATFLTSPEFPLTIEDNKALLEAYWNDPKTYANYFREKFYLQGRNWIGELGVEALDPERKARFFANLEPAAEDLPYFEAQLGEDAGLYWAAAEPRSLSNCPETAFEKFLEHDLPHKAFGLFQHLYSMESLPPLWLFRCLTELEKYPAAQMPGDVFARAYHALSRSLDDEKLEELENLSFKLYGTTLFDCGHPALSPQVTFRRIASEPPYFMALVKASDTLLAPCTKLLIFCGAVPEQPQAWSDEIGALCASESETVQKRAAFWIGYLLYNRLTKNEDGGYALDECTARLLEQSVEKTNGFLHHAQYPNFIHINGDFASDAGDRENARRFRDLARTQEGLGNRQLAGRLNACADDLISGIKRI